jgi:hypothetical protein
MRLRYFPVRLLVLVAAAILVGVVVVGGSIMGSLTDAGPGPAGARPAIPRSGAGLPTSFERPNPHYTPGAVNPQIGLADLCPHLSAAWDRARRSLSASAKIRVKAEYGIPASKRVAEWDHLIARELGGADTEANLWPQVNPTDDHRKDLLENQLHRDVCAGRLDLAEAQDRIVTYWEWW